MNKSLQFKNKFYNFCFLFISFSILLYLTYFLFLGDRGMLNYYKLKNDLLEKKTTYSNINNQNQYITNNIQKLSPNTLDLDYLDEITRNNNGTLRKNEIIIVFSDN